MLLKITGSEIADETTTPTVDVILLERNLRWNWLGQILRMTDRQLVHQMLPNCAKPASESIFGDLIEKHVLYKHSVASRKIGLSGTSIGPRNAANPTRGIKAEHTHTTSRM